MAKHEYPEGAIPSLEELQSSTSAVFYTNLDDGRIMKIGKFKHASPWDGGKIDIHFENIALWTPAMEMYFPFTQHKAFLFTNYWYAHACVLRAQKHPVLTLDFFK